MTHRRPGQSLRDYQKETLRITEEELRLSPKEWEARFGSRHPGRGYTQLLESQRRRTKSELMGHRAAVGATGRYLRLSQQERVIRGTFRKLGVTLGGIDHYDVGQRGTGKFAGGPVHVAVPERGRAVILAHGKQFPLTKAGVASARAYIRR